MAGVLPAARDFASALDDAGGCEGATAALTDEGTAFVDSGVLATATGCLVSSCGVSLLATGCTDDVAGELVALVFDWLVTDPKPTLDGVVLDGGGGGSGDKPKLFLSLAAAAAAADAYFRPSAGRVGKDAGFMVAGGGGTPLLIVCKGVCSVASAGNGDLSCADGRRPPPGAVSAIALAFTLGAGLISGSGTVSSATDRAS